jgi:hypothetical protein
MDARYRLAPMRDARAREERTKRGDLAGAVGDARLLADDVAAVARRIECMQAAITEATAQRERRLAQGGAAGTISHLEHHLRRLRRDLDAAHDEQVRAEARHRGQLAVVDLAQGSLTRARAEREVIERHFAAWRAERRKLAERRED